MKLPLRQETYLAADLLLEIRAQRHGQSLGHEGGGKDVGCMGTARAAGEALQPAKARHEGLERVTKG